MFTLGSFLLLLLGVIFFFVFMGWNFYSLPEKLDGASPEKDSVAADSVTVRSDSAEQKFTWTKISPTEFRDSLFRYQLTLDHSADTSHPAVKRIDIYRNGEQQPFQSIFPSPENQTDYRQGTLEIEDMNFDGYNDFRVFASAYINGCAQYQFWLYDPASGKFKENAALEKTFDAFFDAKEKQVHSVQNMTDSPFNEIRECFRWENGKLVLQHSETCDGFDTLYTLTMQKRIDGKLVTRSHDYHPDPPYTQYGEVIYRWEEMR